jgi:hypothetical protein
MDTLVTAAQLVMGAGLVGLTPRSSGRLFLTLASMRTAYRGPPRVELEDCALPAVLVQLPLYAEGRMVDRLLDAISRLDWPRDRLRAQVPDDSVSISRRAKEHHRISGLRVELLLRFSSVCRNRKGSSPRRVRRDGAVSPSSPRDSGFLPSRCFRAAGVGRSW